MEIYKQLLARVKTSRGLSLDKAKYELVGSNSVFLVQPTSVKFAGFEANKTHTLKVNVLNVSPAPQRLHVLPAQTDFFKIKFNKKGMIPTG